MVIALRVGLIVIALVTVVVTNAEYFVPKSVDCRKSVSWEETAPHGAIWKTETIHWQSVPENYSALVGWINAATAVPCADSETPRPSVEIRKFSIIAIAPDGTETVIETVDPRDQGRFVGRLFPRVPRWFGETEGRNELEITSGNEDGLFIGLEAVPLRVYHAWTEPRIRIDPANRYALEVEARISETARFQFGIDYWRDMVADYAGWDPECTRSNNCEGLVSNWQGGTNGEFQTFRAPEHSFSHAKETVPEAVSE